MTHTRLFGLIALVLFATVVLATPAFAEEESGGLFTDIISKGGAIGIVIIILSVATLALIIEFAVNVRRDKICPPELVDEIEAVGRRSFEKGVSPAEAAAEFKLPESVNDWTLFNDSYFEVAIRAWHKELGGSC